MKFYPKGSFSVNASLLTPGGANSFPGQTESYFLIDADPKNNITAGYVLASEFLAGYAPGSASGKPGEAVVAEREAVNELIAKLG
jgi:hypothetical protein